MADGLNETRALRILEIANDFRTLQTHIHSFVTRQSSSPPDRESQGLDGYVLIRQCGAEAHHILAVSYDPGNMGLRPGTIPATEVQRASLQRIILDASTRRFQAHKIYLKATAAARWIQNRTQILQGQRPASRHTEALRGLDQRLRQELAVITDQYVFNQLRENDRRRSYWRHDDPTLENILAWAQQQR